MTATLTAHPARYSKALLPTLFEWTAGSRRILDPMAGVGSARFGPGMVCNELEPEWAAQCPRPVTVGDATRLPYRDGTFDCVVTSPAYGNRMADNYAGDAKGSKRYTYRISLGRRLSERSGASLQWGAKYKALHTAAWAEVYRVLEPGGIFILNVKDHCRKGAWQDVPGWHVGAARSAGFRLEDSEAVDVPSQRHGKGGELRADFEHVFLLRKPWR